jgi:hypothetical protein
MAGTSTTIDVTGWSNAPVADWTISARFVPGFRPGLVVCGSGGSPGPFDPHPQLSSTLINNGQRVSLTLTIPPGTMSCSWATVLIYSGSRFWPIKIVAL